jgi:hypothetical protein
MPRDKMVQARGPRCIYSIAWNTGIGIETDEIVRVYSRLPTQFNRNPRSLAGFKAVSPDDPVSGFAGL